MKNQESEIGNDFAKNVKDEDVHISQAESGKKGYWCPACKQEMVAYKSDIQKEYFGHYSKDVEKKGKCTYSNETYRHYIAKVILQQIKQIKVPDLWKYPLSGEYGKPYRLKKSETINAHSVSSEIYFYENENGEIKYGKNIDIIDGIKKHLVIKPDITFFDEKDNPFLLIELKATHKVDAEKLLKLQKLGINTVEIKIPKSSQEEIQKTFYSTESTIWLYNYERANTKYISIPTRDGEGIQSFNEDERRFLDAGESFECKSNQIKNLIRRLTKCLESEQFKESERKIRDELLRVETNTENARIERERIRAGIRKKVDERMELRREDHNRRREAIGRGRNKITGTKQEYGYFSDRKIEDLEREEREYKSEYEKEIKRIESEFGTNSDEIEIRIRNDYNKRYRNIVFEESELERVDKEEKRLNEERRTRLENENRELEEKFRSDETTERENFKSEEGRIIIAIETENGNIISRVQNDIRTLLEVRRQLFDIKQAEISYKRLRKYKELIEENVYKNWH